MKVCITFIFNGSWLENKKDVDYCTETMNDLDHNDDDADDGGAEMIIL